MKIRGSIGGIEVVVLIDCGATHNFVSRRLIEMAGLVVSGKICVGVILGNGKIESRGNDIIPVAEEVPIVNVNPVENDVSLEGSSSVSPAKRIRRSYLTYPCIGNTSVSSQREQRILEKLQEDKVLIQAELTGLLESLENQEMKMDRKTVARSLNKLQKNGHCKCISFTFPSANNYGGKRTTDVVLHPSVFKAEDLSDRIHEKIRSFERQTRTKMKNSKSRSFPVLNNVERINTNVKDNIQAKTSEAMKNNGFVLAKMVRVKLLHVFLWGYLTKSPGWDDAISGKDGYERKNPPSTCKLLELDAAIKAMPLELFLQVAGSSETLESVVEKCRDGLCLSDLPINEYRSLMGTRATGLISNLIDILRRLKSYAGAIFADACFQGLNGVPDRMFIILSMIKPFTS